MKLGDLIGDDFEEDFTQWKFEAIQSVLNELATNEPIDIAHAEMLQQKSLRAADIISDYLGKIVKISSYLENRVSSLKNKAALQYKGEKDKVTDQMRKFAAESDPDVDKLNSSLAKAKGVKVLLEKKYEILIKTHHYYKEISIGMKKTF